MADDRKFRWVGTRPIRHDGVDKVTVRANFGADLALQGMLWGKILRSPHAHARIVRIDTRRAEALDGVKAVATSADLPEPKAGGAADLSSNILARGKALYHGHAVAAVAATTAQIAEQALDLIDVEYETLPPVLSLDAALAPDAAILDDERRPRGLDDTGPTNIASRMELARGEPEEAFASCDVVLERSYRTQTVHQGYIEPHACVVESKADGQIDIWCSTQGGFAVRSMTAGVLGLDNSQIKVTPSEIGGGFGGRTTIYLEPVAAVLSRKSGRPVKMVMSREEVFRGAGPGFSTHLCDVEVDPETGRVDVIRYTAIQDAGRAIHPSYVEGQMQGGAVQGIGWALNEEYLFDEDGEMENPGFLDYRVPVTSDLPMIDAVILEIPSPFHPYGVRGVGETPIVAPLAAVANAVQHASGVRMESLPISPPRLLAALQERAAE